MKKEILNNPATYGLILLIAIGTGALDYFTPLMGDDMSKWLAMGGDSVSFPDRRALSFLAGQYFGCNGRVFDALGPLITNLLPRGLASALIGLMCGFFFWSICLVAGVLKRGRAALACSLTVVSLMVLPWWDSMFMRVCHFNYVWAAAFVLLFVYKWFQEDSNRYLLFVLGCLAGCFHEQIGASLVVVFGVYMVITRSVRRNLLPYTGVCLGALITVATPAIWQRNSEFIADGSRLEMLLTTFPIMIFAIILTAMLLIRRSRLMPILRSRKYVVLLSLAVVSSVIALYSTIPGRTGWLAESCSLAALGLLCAESKVKISSTLAGAVITLCFLIVLTHFSVSIYWQKKMYGEYQEVIELYRESESGIVRADYTSRLEVSPLTLYRVKGLPDGDDTYLLSVFSRYYGPDKPLILIDSEFEVVDTLPGGVERVFNSISDTILIIGSNVVTPFEEGGKSRFLIEPLTVDPGDNWHNVE